jgi:DNA-binding NtrC family response regulator
MKTIVAIDDEVGVLGLVQRALERPDRVIHTYPDPLVALQCLEQHGADLIILDLRMPQANGIEVLKKCRLKLPNAKVIILTGHGGVKEAVQAMKAGAADFFTKPLRLNDLSEIVAKLLDLQDVAQEQRAPGADAKPVEISGPMGGIFHQARVVAAKDTPVLITGETGVGKEVLANFIQRNSARAAAPYIKVNCAAFPENLIESELFGHEKGSFTGAVERRLGRFERAHRGTIFLDEIGELSLSLQAKLLRVLQTREIERVGGETPVVSDFRLLCATHRDLSVMVREGAFREDLFYRISVFPIRVPSLRERPEDVLALSETFLKRAQESVGKAALSLASETRALLCGYAWPGNVRELENAIDRAVIMATGAELLPEDFWWLNNASPAYAIMTDSRPKAPVQSEPAASETAPAQPAPPTRSPLEDAERAALLATLKKNKWNFTRAAAELKISRSTLYLKASRYELSRH